MYIRYIIISIIFLSSTAGLHAQLFEQDTVLVSPDSLEYVPQENRYTLFNSFGGVPGRAIVYGMVFPAGGQYYNKRYIKGSLFLLAELGLLYFAIDQTREYNAVNSCYKTLLVDTSVACFGTNNPDLLISYRDNLRQQKDFMWLGFGILHVLVVAEAFVDRHLMEFDVSDDLSLQIKPLSNGSLLSLSLSFN